MNKVYPKIFNLEKLLPNAIQEILSGAKTGGIKGLKTGYHYFDLATSGLQNGQLIIIAGRPGMGKSAFCHNIAVNVAGNGVPVAYFSLEMPTSDVISRIISTKYDVDSKNLRSGLLNPKETAKVEESKKDLAKLPIYISSYFSATIEYIEQTLDDIPNVGLIIIDYLTLLKEIELGNLVNTIGKVSRGLKLLAMKRQIPIILVSQLNRDCEKRNPPIPIMSDLRDSGNLEQDADAVILVYRQSYYFENCNDPLEAQVIVAKQRGGSTGRVLFDFDGKYYKFTEKKKQT